MQHAAAVQRLDRPPDLPGDGPPFLRRQRPVAGDVVRQRFALEILQNEIGPGPVRVGPAEVADADEGGVVDVLDPAALSKDHFDGAVEGVRPQRFDDDWRVGLAVAAEEGGPEAAGAEDAERLVAVERERLEGVGVEGGGAANGGERLVPVAALEGGAVDVVVRLGLRDGVGDETGDFLKVVLPRLDVADDDFELGEAVEQGRQPPPLLRRQVAEALHEVLDDFALAVAAEGEAVARPDGAGVQVVAPPLQPGHGVVRGRGYAWPWRSCSSACMSNTE